MKGRQVGNYRIVEQIGMGGMATVYKAYEAATDRYVALKILPQMYTQDDKFHKRFEREARALAKLEHFHILPIFTYGEDEGITYLVMRYMPAGTLTDKIKAEGLLKLHNVSHILKQIAAALDYAHQNGVLHRDVKPSNVLLDEEGNAYLTDFGIAKMVEPTVDLTGGAFLGTPAYMSPEQCQGGADLTEATDQYSLGIVLYEMVTGRTPFQAETPIALIHMQLTAPLPPPSTFRADLPEAVESVLFKALARNPEDRFPTCTAMAEAFEQALVGIPVDDYPTPTQPAGEPVGIQPAHPDSPTVDMLPGDQITAAASAKQSGLPVWLWPVIALVGIGVIAGALFFGLRGDKGDQTVEAADNIPATTAAEPGVPVSPGVSPIGTERIGLCEWDGYGDGICIREESGGSSLKAQILEDSDLVMGNPGWSYDGTQIIFSAGAPGEDLGKNTKMYIVNRDGSGLTQLDGIGNDVEPDWGPDDWLAFHSNGKLGIMKVDGTEKQYLFDPGQPHCISNPHWSPDGEWIVFAVPEQCGSDTMPQERQLWVVSRDGSQSWMLFTDTYQTLEGYFSEYDFDPAGGRIAFLDAELNPMIINMAEGSEPLPLTTFPDWWMDYVYPHE